MFYPIAACVGGCSGAGGTPCFAGRGDPSSVWPSAIHLPPCGGKVLMGPAPLLRESPCPSPEAAHRTPSQGPSLPHRRDGPFSFVMPRTFPCKWGGDLV